MAGWVGNNLVLGHADGLPSPHNPALLPYLECLPGSHHVPAIDQRHAQTLRQPVCVRKVLGQHGKEPRRSRGRGAIMVLEDQSHAFSPPVPLWRHHRVHEHTLDHQRTGAVSVYCILPGRSKGRHAAVREITPGQAMPHGTLDLQGSNDLRLPEGVGQVGGRRWSGDRAHGSSHAHVWSACALPTQRPT